MSISPELSFNFLVLNVVSGSNRFNDVSSVRMIHETILLSCLGSLWIRSIGKPFNAHKTHLIAKFDNLLYSKLRIQQEGGKGRNAFRQAVWPLSLPRPPLLHQPTRPLSVKNWVVLKSGPFLSHLRDSQEQDEKSFVQGESNSKTDSFITTPS
jgi:hypothetical protein